MNATISRNLIRLVAVPVIGGGIIGGALGLAAVADASTGGATHPHVVSADQGHGNTQGGTGTGGGGNTQGGTGASRHQKAA